MFTPQTVMLLSAMLFCLGVYGVLARRNLLVLLMSLELMLTAVNIMLVLFSRIHAGEVMQASEILDQHAGQFFSLMIMTVAAGEVGVGLAIVITIYRMRHSIEVNEAAELRL